MQSNNELILSRLFYVSPLGSKYRGQLIITGSEFLFESEFDETFEIINRSNIQNINGKTFFSLLKDDISSVEFKQSFFRRKMIVSQNGRTHQFIGMNLSKTAVFNAIKNAEDE